MDRNDNGGSVEETSGTRTIYAACEVESMTAPRVRLSVMRGPDKGVEFSWEGLLVRVGSSLDNDLVLSDETVSRNHFRIELDEKGYRIRDLGSKNGLLVDSIAVIDAYLPASCRITLGDTVLKYREGRETVEVEIATGNRLGDLIGCSSQMRHLFALIQKVAKTDATVLIEGESGTGKELTAYALHEMSARKGRCFEIVDCSAIPDSIIESELFGHVRGAFTGAIASRKGAIESAAGGTLFLDEISELPLPLQGKVLRLIERREVKSVGGDSYRTIDARIIAASNRNLRDEVSKGNFREDLYYRLAVMKLRVPPLRERPEDIGLLVEALLDMFSRRDGKLYTVTHSMMTRLLSYEFPGNVRELKNLLERSCLLSEGVELDIEFGTRPPLEPGGFGFESLMTLPYKDAKDALVSAFEEKYWTRLLELCDDNVSEAARRGGIHRKSLEYLLKKFRPRQEE